MAKREIKFNNLERVWTKPLKTYPDEELLSAIRDPHYLASKSEAEQLLIVGAIKHQMHASEGFKRRVWEAFDQSLQKNR